MNPDMCLWLMMSQWLKLMMEKRPAGFKMENSQSERRVLAGAFTKATSFAQLMGGLLNASKTLEYGKNHKGFWNGALFLKQTS
jgi:hypothetical protein